MQIAQLLQAFAVQRQDLLRRRRRRRRLRFAAWSVRRRLTLLLSLGLLSPVHSSSRCHACASERDGRDHRHRLACRKAAGMRCVYSLRHRHPLLLRKRALHLHGYRRRLLLGRARPVGWWPIASDTQDLLQPRGAVKQQRLARRLLRGEVARKALDGLLDLVQSLAILLRELVHRAACPSACDSTTH